MKDEDFINEAYLDKKLSKIKGQISLRDEDYKKFKLCDNKHSEGVLIEKAVETTKQILYDKGLFDKYHNADEVLKDYSFVERRRPDLEELNVDVVTHFIHKYASKNKATLNTKIHQILPSLDLSDVGIYLRDGLLSSHVEIFNLHPTKRTQRTAYINQNYFVSYGCSPPQKLSRFIIKRNGQYLNSKKKQNTSPDK